MKSPGKDARIWEFITELPYPADPVRLAEYRASAKTRIEASGNLRPTEQADIEANGKKQLEDYFNGRGTRAATAADFDKVMRWAEANHIKPGQIFVGEFGVTQETPSHGGALPEDRARWFSDVRREAERRVF